MMPRTDEFPLLQAQGLTIIPIRGDGNCLFNALSDQLYGSQDKHFEIRSVSIQYLRDHAQDYMHFVASDGIRRAPKRKNAAAFSTVNTHNSTEAELLHNFEQHLKSMANGGTYGDHLELIGFIKAYDTDLKIYKPEFSYYVRAANDNVERPVAHIALHNYEHYSSIRNINGPFKGLPNIRPLDPSPEEIAKAQSNKPGVVQQWMIKSVMSTLPHLVDEAVVVKALEKHKGHVDSAVSELLDADSSGSTPSSPGSSGAERDADSDDDDIYGPKKRQNRRKVIAMKNSAKMEENEKTLSLIPTFEITKPEVTQLDSDITSLDFTPLKPPSLSTLSQPTLLPKLSHDLSKARKAKKVVVDDDDFAPSDNEGSDYQLDDDDDAGSVYSSRSTNSRATSISLGSSPPRPKIILNTKSKLKQNGPKRITARERKEIKKAAQKQARKTTKRDNAKASQLSESTSGKRNGRNSPPMESVNLMKTLYI